MSLGRFVALQPMTTELGLADGARDGWSHIRWWLGRDTSGGDAVAIGLLPAEHAEVVSRARERAAGIAHEHLLPLVDVAQAGGQVGMVLPWPDAGSLRALLNRRRRLPVGELLTAVSPIAAALAAVHAGGLVHGSVGSATIWLDGAGRPALVALAPALVERELDGSLPGTVGDLSPEVVRAHRISPGSDVFSLGSVLLHGVCGEPAWPADDAADVLVQSAAGLWPDLPDDAAPEELVRLLRRMLHPDPVRRPPVASIPARLSALSAPAPLDMAAAAADPTESALTSDETAADTVDADPDPPPAGAATGDSAHDGGQSRHAAARVRRRSVDLPRRRVLAIAVGVVSAALLAVGAIQAGLWWASWDQAAADGTPPAVADASPPTAADPAPPGGREPTPSAAATPVDVTPADGTPADGTPADGTPADGTAAVPASALGDPAGGEPDWRAVVADLDARRARAFAAADAGLLDSVYAAGAPARQADAAAIAELSAAGLRVPDATHAISAVEEIAVGAATLPGPAVRLRIVDALPAHPIVDASGATVGSTPSRDESERIVDLARDGAEYRILSIEEL